MDYRSISLCNVIYKIIAKSLANRIKPHLPDIIDLLNRLLLRVEGLVIILLLLRKSPILLLLNPGINLLSCLKLILRKLLIV